MIKTHYMLVMGYLGAVIGAGFASGQEIVQFFVRYGQAGLAGCILCVALFAVCGGVLMHLAHRYKASNYQALLTNLTGSGLACIIDIGLAVFLFLGISTMLSASGAVFLEYFHLPKNLGILVAYLAVLCALVTGKNGMVRSYNLLVPVKIILLISIAGAAAMIPPAPDLNAIKAFVTDYQPTWLISSILYVAYNFSLAMVVLVEYQTFTTGRAAVTGAAMGGAILGILVIVNYLALYRFLPMTLHYQVPMLYVAGKLSSLTQMAYCLVLWIGIITTAIANAYGFSQRFAKLAGIHYGLCLALSLTLALPIATQSFDSLVARIYPCFGILGILILVLLLYRAGKDMIDEMYYNIRNAR